MCIYLNICWLYSYFQVTALLDKTRRWVSPLNTYKLEHRAESMGQEWNNTGEWIIIIYLLWDNKARRWVPSWIRSDNRAWSVLLLVSPCPCTYIWTQWEAGIFFSFTQYSACGRQMEPRVKTLRFSLSAEFLESLRVKKWNSTPRFWFDIRQRKE